MNYCSNCANPVVLKIPNGDNRPRHVCEYCGTIHYQNPRIVAGCLPEQGEKILLCRRGIEPGYGLWTLPAGFMENGETTQETAAREAMEEANAKVVIGPIYALFNLPDINQVYMLYRGRLDGRFSPGQESLETALYHENDIPWSEIAFATISKTLKRFYRDRLNKKFPLYTDTVTNCLGTE